VLLRIFALRQVFFASSTLLVTMTTIHTNPATSTSMLVFAITPQMIGIRLRNCGKFAEGNVLQDGRQRLAQQDDNLET